MGGFYKASLCSLKHEFEAGCGRSERANIIVEEGRRYIMALWHVLEQITPNTHGIIVADEDIILVSS